MITIDNVKYRNLEEQVQKNKEDIAAHYNMDRVLADFGIRVIGRVDTPEDLPDPDTYAGDYGDAYAVGVIEDGEAEPPFTFYVWTRPDPDAGYPNAYWFNIGELAIIGPQGVPGSQGPAGPQGTRGSLWYYGTAVPANASQYNEGDLYLRNNGDIYQITKNGTAKSWTKRTNIMGAEGPQGEQGETGPAGAQGLSGPQGPKGDTGALCRIVGSITSVSQLPTPTESIRYDGYTQTIGEDTHLWIITGDTNLQWMDIGVVGGAGGGGGTNVVINGVVQDEWDASKVLTNPLTSSTGFLYQSSSSGTYTTKVGQQQISSSTVSTDVPALRNSNGTMDVMRDAALTSVLNSMAAGSAVPDRYPNSSTDGAIRKNQATPRGYVDQLVENAMEQTISDAELIVNNAVSNCLNYPEALGNINDVETTFVGIANDDGSQMGYAFGMDTYILPTGSDTYDLMPNYLYIITSSDSDANMSTNLTTLNLINRSVIIVMMGNDMGDGTRYITYASKANTSSWVAGTQRVQYARISNVSDSTTSVLGINRIGMFPV